MISSSESLAQRISSIALDTFEKLPSKCKPRIQANGLREWTPMSAIVVGLKDEVTGHEHLRCLSLATGTKCLPASQIKQCNGLVLHDCHAEILAFRGFNCWLLHEMKAILQDSDYRSECVEMSDQFDTEGQCEHRPFRLRQQISLYLFSTTAPCGDASMGLLISSSADQTPWSADSLANDLSSGQPPGRGHFSLLGAVRRKPARRDAEATMSKSCTDKITLKQFLSLLAFPADTLVQADDRTFLKGLVVYHDQYDETGYERAFGPGGRLKSISKAQAVFLDVYVLPEGSKRFEFDRDARQGTPKVSNVCALFIAGSKDGSPVQESLVNGVKQGHKQFGPDPRKASMVSRRAMFDAAREIYALLESNHMPRVSDGTTYEAFKNSSMRHRRLLLKKRIVEELQGWVSNSAEDNFRAECAASSRD